MINTMLDNMDKNIRDIYQLQLSQKMPICGRYKPRSIPISCTIHWNLSGCTPSCKSRMNWVILFMSLVVSLRNNISDERVTTVENELEFCRKYSYLCMVRYPKSIAYGFKIDPGLEKMKIPKFTIQPLVENYFAHGWIINARTM